ncbi:glycogen synthase GlgA [Enorma burkinafasonensis]|uniref:glycogen synthase GlgA n=1 Tax=Enorma burkinafasonensis TaxID=2590867 RepID=UPI0026F08989|nr:glycogen synthase GlgA [Enorma burkinafasonensis]MCI7730901.1 glycogen synthase GlgA [Enorma burkinafasonensis]
MSDKKLQVVIASAECAPFVKTGGLGDVAGSLPQALVAAGADVIVMVPKYGSIPARYTERMEHFRDFYVSLGWRNEYCGLERLDMGNGVTYLFVDNEHYFLRDYPYGFFDDGERFAFFSKAVCESLQYLPEGFECDVLHCNDWHTALAPVFLREFYQGLPLYERVKTVFTIHNIAFQGQYSDTILNDILGLAHIPAAAGQLRCDDRSINYMQGALKYTDAITTVSPSYAWEIQTPEYGEGLDGILRERSSVLSGILNGIDTDAWDPATDTAIAENFKVGDMAGKAACKAALQEELGLEVRDDRPLMVMVTRLTRQKGMDLVTYALDRILSGGVQVAVLGTGDYEEPMRYFADKYPGTMAARITFDSALSHRMYAGADLFLMPSLFEPCGLSQIIAMRYGTLPVVRETGGLRDTVTPYNHFTGEGTGFSFANFNGDEMGDAVFRGARLFWDDRAAWDQVVRQAMETDFSWTRSAAAYLDLYRGLHPECAFVVPAPAAAPAAEPAATPEPKVKPAAAPEPEVKPADAAEPAANAEAAPAPAKKPATKKTPARKTAAKKAEPAKAEGDAPKKATRTTARKTAAAAKATTATGAKKPAAKSTAAKAAAEKPATKMASAKKATAKEAVAETAAGSAPKTTAAKKTTTKRSGTAAKAAPAKKATPAPKAAAAAEEPAEKPAPKARTVSAARKTTRKRSS